MKHAIVRNVALFGGLALSGAACVMAAPYMTSVRGAAGPSVLLARSPVAALLAVIICLALATAVAIGVARLANACVGLFVLGAGLFVLAGRLETIAEIALTSGGSNRALVILAVETLLWACLCYVAVLAVFRFAGPLPDVHPEERNSSAPSLSFLSRLPVKGQALKSVLAAAVVLPLVWVIAQSTMKGQMLGATFVGAMMAGLVGRLVAPNIQPTLLFVAPIVFGAIGHIVGFVTLKAPLEIAWVTGDLPALSLPMPVDYAAGSLMGVAVGLGWARSFLHHEDGQAQALNAA